jgi:hypothetical protein
LTTSTGIDSSYHKRPTLNYNIISGLDFLLGHFKPENLFPRTISTKLTEGSQKIVYDRKEILKYFAEADLNDCKISAFHSTNWRKRLSKLVEPDLLFIDLDVGVFGNNIALAAALDATLIKIKKELCGYSTVIWSGNGYHIYQPVKALILEQQDLFNRFKQPSRRFLQFAEEYLSDGKMDKCHNKTISFNNCMLRVPGSHNSKSDMPKKVEIIQRWDGNRPCIGPLLFRYYLYMQDRKLIEIRKQHDCLHTIGGNKFCQYLTQKLTTV